MSFLKASVFVMLSKFHEDIWTIAVYLYLCNWKLSILDKVFENGAIFMGCIALDLHWSFL